MEEFNIIIFNDKQKWQGKISFSKHYQIIKVRKTNTNIKSDAKLFSIYMSCMGFIKLIFFSNLLNETFL